MPELKNNFTRGRMNKDLDERLVPNGEYRDAANIQIGTSLGSDVGAIETLRGNERRKKNVLDTSNDDWRKQWGLGSDVKCVGTYADTQSNKIYWFIANEQQNKSAILEYNEASGAIAPIIVDVRPATGAGSQILKFNFSYKITAINVVNGILYWTDDNTAPRKINIERFKKASAGVDVDGNPVTRVSTANSNILDNTTHIYEYNSGTARPFTSPDITVITRAPRNALTVAASPSAIYTTGVTLGTSISPAITTGNFSNGNFGPLANGTIDVPFTILGTDSVANFATAATAVGQQIVFTAEEENDDGSLIIYEVLGEITSRTGTSREFKFTMLSGSANMPNGTLTWEVMLLEGDPIFKDEFARFTYRWKYYDGDYSPYAPFSKAAFVPSNFAYSQTSAYNKGMDNQIRRVALSNFEDILPNVIAVEILYKSSASNNVYEIRSFDRAQFLNADGPASIPYVITKTPSGPVVEANQLIRPYDNVPRKAKAQEIIGNRVVYGNYLQNYNIGDGIQNAYIISEHKTVNRDPAGTILGIPSVKSDRDYQIGLTWIDGQGRETPVFTSEGSGVTVSKESSDVENLLQAKADLINMPGGTVPDWATHYKFYVKDSASDYHNLAMDRFYFAEDGNIWLSFPSSERNKVKEGDYFILKKEHDTNTPIQRNNRFKILSLENEAPEFIKKRRQEVAAATCFATQDNTSTTLAFEDTAFSDGFPHLEYKSFISGNATVRFRGPTVADKPEFHNSFGDELEIQFFNEDYTKSSSIYKIQAGGPTGETNITGHSNNNKFVVYNEFLIVLKSGILASDTFLFTLGADVFEKFNVKIYHKIGKSLPEFSGRFFAKIEQNATSRNHIVSRVSNLTMSKVSLGTIDTSLTNGSQEFQNEIMPTPVDFFGNASGDKKFEEEKVKSFPSGGYDVVHAGFGDEHAVDGDAAYNPTNQIVDLDIPGAAYVPPGESQSFSIGFVAGFADDYENMGNYNNYPRSGKSYTEAKLKNNATLTPEQIELHRLFDLLKVGKSIRLKKADNSYTLPFTIINSTDLYYYREVSERTTILTGVYSSVGRKIDITLDGEPSLGDDGVKAIEIFEQNLESVGDVLSSDNPAIFETEPVERADLDIYYEASDALPINDAASIKILDYINCFSFGNGVESNKIRDDFNSANIGKGVRVSSVLKEPYKEERRKAGLIYSGIINSTSGINETNQFIAGIKITKDLNPVYGGIQKLYARGGGAQGDLLTLMEDKCFRILANKDALFNADGNANLTSSNNVLGQAIPFQGEFGISKNPESFASYNFRSYFTDKSRGAVLRLSADGLTVISDKGMSDFFNDLMELNYPLSSPSGGGLIGSYDITTDTYNLAFGAESYSFKEASDGWVTRLTYAPEAGISLNNKYYTFNKSNLYSHDSSLNSVFYEISSDSSVDVLLNAEPSKIKNFKTVYYEGDHGWLCEVETDQGAGFVKTSTKGKWGDNNDVTLLSPVGSTATSKEGIWYGWIRGNELDPVNNSSVGKEFSVIGLGSVASEEVNTGGNTGFNKLTYNEPLNISLSDGDKIYVRVNISGTQSRLIGTVQHYTSGQPGVSEDRKEVIIKTTGLAYNAEGTYTYAIKDNELNTSGLIGYYAKLKFSVPGKGKEEKNELFAVGSEIFISS